MAHYELDVQPDLVRAVRRTYRAIATALAEEAALVTQTPTTIGDDWTGRAATTVKHDIRALGRLLTKFHDHFATAAEALKVLADVYDDELAALGKLNTRRSDADAEHTSALADLRTRQERERGEHGTRLPQRRPS